MKTVTITIDEEGAVKIETAGFQGAGCRAATADIEKAMGETTADKTTAEFFATAAAGALAAYGGKR